MVAVDVLRWIGNGLMIWAAAVGVASVVVYSRVQWWHSQIGRHLMTYQAIIAVVLVLSSIRIFIGDSWYFALLRLAVFTGVPLVMTQRLYLLIQAQRDDARGTAATPHADKPGTPDGGGGGR